MRLHLAAAVFLLALFAAACGGGGGSSTVVPTQAVPGPHSQQVVAQAMMLKIPAPGPTAAGRKRPAYVSPATKSALVIVTPITVPSSTPLASQLFPVATPSPCTQNPDGSKNCTFQVNVPYGNDSIQVETFNVANPGPNDVPLATFNSTLSVTPGSAPPPVSFTLSGVVSSVSLSIASPEPSISPETTIALAGVAMSPAPIAITPYDQSGNPILTDDFSTPISLSVDAAASGVQLEIVNSQCSPAASSSPSASVSVTCAKDLANVRYLYNGGLGYDGSHNIIDTIAISASPNPSATASTIGVRLRSNVMTYVLPSPSSPPSYAVSDVDANDNVTYMFEGYNASAFGRFNVASPNSAIAANVGYESYGMAVSNGGSVWLAQSYSSLNGPLYALDCFRTIGATPTETVNITAALLPLAKHRAMALNPVSPTTLARDAQGNIWFAGNDTTNVPYAGYIPASQADCTAPTSVAASVALLTGYPEAIGSTPTGVLVLTDYDLYPVTTQSSGTVQPTPLPSPYYSYYMKTDGNGDAILALDGAPAPTIGYLPAGTSNLTVASLPSNLSLDGVALYPSSGSASRFSWTDSYFGFFGLGDVSAPASQEILPMANSVDCLGTFFDLNGDAWAECLTGSGVNVSHVMRTSTWNVVAPGFFSNRSSAIGILERGDSSPFALTGNSDPTDVTLSTDPSWTGFTHDIPVNVSGVGSGSFTATVTDAHQRSISATIPLATPPPCTQCLLRQRSPAGGHRHVGNLRHR